MRLKAIIIEDERLARDLIKNFLEGEDHIELIGEFEDGFSGLKAVNELKPDLIFLDIQMPKLSGLEMLELVENMPQVIFTTAYDEHAIKAFELNAVDYLLKPFSKARFNKALEKITAQKPNQTERQDQIKAVERSYSDGQILSKIAVKNGSKIEIIPVEQIRYLEAQDDYVMIYDMGGKHLKNGSLKEYEERLDPANFIRIHRSYMININRINRIEKYGKESYKVIMKSGEPLSISRNRYQRLKEVLGF